MSHFLHFCLTGVVTSILLAYFPHSYVEGEPIYGNEITDIIRRANADSFANQMFQYKASSGPEYDVLVRHRRKRTANPMMLITSAILRGMQAMRILLMGTKELPPNGRIHQYAKRGGFKQATKDFFSIHPTDVEKFRMFQGTTYRGVGMRGRVGDLTITIRNKGIQGKPTMEIMKTKIENGYPKIKKTDVFFYGE